MAFVIAVIGATGNQGGSVVRSLHQNPSFKVRGITRNITSEASQSLISVGVEMIQADGFNYDEMVTALEGASGLYLNINSDDNAWRNRNGPTEFDLGKAIINAAVQAGVEILVYSGGPPCSQMTGGKVRCKAMDMKSQIENYARKLEVFRRIVIVNPAWYLENFLVKEVAPVFGGFPHFPDEEGFLTFRVPNWGGDNKVPFLSITEDYGDIVHGIFLDIEQYNGRIIHGMSDILRFDEVVATFQEVTGRKARFLPVLPSWQSFDTQGIPELEDVKLMFGLTQSTGGRYFGDEPSEIQTATSLKQVSTAALGRPQKLQNLVTVREFFRKYFLQNVYGDDQSD